MKKKKYKSSVTKNHRIKKLRSHLSLSDFAPEIKKKKHCGKITLLLTLKFHNITNMFLFSIMSSSDAMFETFLCVFPVCK